MPLETVDVLVQSDDLVPEPLDGVVVRVYDSTGTTLITQGTTGAPAAAGHVEFTLDGTDPATRYQLRFFKSGVAISSPKAIDVYSPVSSAPTGTNNFQVDGTVLTLPSAVDPLLCRASGYIKNPVGQAWRGTTIQFIPVFEPLVAGDVGVIGERVAIKTDSTGFVQVDLYRNCTYDVTIQGHDNVLRTILVPDRVSVNIMHLLFPIVRRVTFSPAPPWTIPVGTTITVVPTVEATDYRTLEGTATDDLDYVSGDTAVLGVSSDADALYLTGVATGSTTLEVSRRDGSIVYVPDPGIDGDGAAIDVV